MTLKVYIMEAEGSGVRLKFHPTYPTLPIIPQNVKSPMAVASGSSNNQTPRDKSSWAAAMSVGEEGFYCILVDKLMRVERLI